MKKSPAAPPPAPTATPLVADIRAPDLNSFSSQPGRVAILEFYAPWSGQSRQLAPVLLALCTENAGRLVVGRVNIDTYKEFAGQAGAKTVPDVRIFRDAKQVDRFVGLPDSDEIRRRVEKQLAALPPPPAPGKEPAAGVPSMRPMPKDWLPPGMKRR